MYDLSSQTNSIGRLSYESNDVNASGAYNYDAMGRVTSRSYCVPLNCSLTIQAQATYDLAGNMTSQTYPDGRKISQGFDAAGRESSVTYTSWNGNGHSTPYLTVSGSGGYDPAGHLINATMGDGLGITASYDSRERVHTLLYGTSTNLLWGKSYQWYPNSNLQSYTDAFTGISRQFSYDSLNRLQSAQDIVGPFSGSWSVPTGSSSTGGSSGATPTGTEGSPGGASFAWTDPDDSNLLLNPDEPGSFGWSLNQVTLQSGITAPDGTSSAYNIVAATGTSTDGWVGDGTAAVNYSGETMTASVWLRSANGPHTVNLYMLEFANGGNTGVIAASKAVAVTTNWQQFSLSGRVEQNLGTLYLQIGGADSVSNGQAISIWNPMMEDSGVSGTTITNFVPYSQRFTESIWQRTSGLSIVDNSAVAPAPDGSNTASLVTASAGPSESYFVGAIANPAPYPGLPITASIWLRCVTGTQNISLALLSDTTGTPTVANSIVTLTTTWQRFAITGTETSLAPLSFYVGGAVTFVSGDAILVWGAQIELASTAGPYLATGGRQVSAGTSLTNVLPYSQQPNGPSWIETGAQVTLAAVIAPDSSGTGTQVTAQANQNDAYISNDVPNPALYDGATVTGSVFLRVASGTQTISLAFGADAPGRVYVGLQTVTLNTSWQRFTISGQLPNGLNRLFLQVGGGGSFSTGQSFDIWGTQVEVSPTAGPYVMTSALPVISGQELTNILPSSQQLNGPGWQTQFGSVAVNAATAPDGSTTAGIFTAASTSTDSYISDFVANPSLYDSQTVTASVYLRVASGTLNTTLYLNNLGDAGWQIQQSAPITVTTTWQRFSVTGTNQNGLTLFYLQIGGAGSINSGQSLQIWGAQMAVGNSPAPYTPTINGTTNVANGAAATLLQNGLNQTYSYDSFGNIQQNGGFNDSYTAQNQMFGYAHDAAGNLLSNYLTTMTWDAESKLTSTGGATYIYDPEGNRVEKQGVGVTDTIFFGGRPIARYSGDSWTDLIYGPNGMFAEVAGTETAQSNYRLLDHLGNQVGTVGSTILLTNPLDYTPFGQTFSGSTNDPYMFTGKERDQESGLDYFGARYYGSNMGRFMSPDWADKPEAVPYSSLGDPQSLNLYSYVLNNPMRSIDADGHDLDCSGSTGGGAGCQAIIQWNTDHDVSASAWAAIGLTGSSRAQQQSTSQNSGGNKSNAIYRAFVLGSQYGEQAIGSDDQTAVLVRHVGFTDNVQIPGDTLDEGKASSGWKDPLTSFHGGAESFYFGGPLHLFGVDAGHVAAGAGSGAAPGLEGHHDTFGPLNPIHWLFEALPSLFINTRNSAVAQPCTCSISGGCAAQ
jgi:RHS repeat-associated protein